MELFKKYILSMYLVLQENLLDFNNKIGDILQLPVSINIRFNT